MVYSEPANLPDIILPPAPNKNRHRSLMHRIKGRVKKTFSPPLFQAESYEKVRLSYWRPASGVNFGDEIARTVAILMAAEYGITFEDEAICDRQLLTVGSVLHMAEDNAVIWGSGLNGAVSESDHRYKSLDVRATRGPITREFLRRRGISSPEIYGDPALLIPTLTRSRFTKTNEIEIGLVPNLFDLSIASSEIEKIGGIHLIDPMRSWDTVVSDILRCNFVIASSLHGLILADAFGIPARYTRFTDHEPDLKYIDYYLGTGRNFSPANTIAEAINMGGCDALRYDPTELIAAFPRDLWKH